MNFVRVGKQHYRKWWLPFFTCKSKQRTHLRIRTRSKTGKECDEWLWTLRTLYDHVQPFVGRERAITQGRWGAKLWPTFAIYDLLSFLNFATIPHTGLWRNGRVRSFTCAAYHRCLCAKHFQSNARKQLIDGFIHQQTIRVKYLWCSTLNVSQGGIFYKPF